MMKQAFGDYRKLMKELGTPTHPGGTPCNAPTAVLTKGPHGSQDHQSNQSNTKNQDVRRRLLSVCTCTPPLPLLRSLIANLSGRLSTAQSRVQSTSDLKRRQERRRLLTKGSAPGDTPATVAQAPNTSWSMQADTTTPFHFAFGTPTLTSNDDHLHTIAAELRSRRHAAAAAPAAAAQFQFNFADNESQLTSEFATKASLQSTVSSKAEFKFNFGDAPSS